MAIQSIEEGKILKQYGNILQRERIAMRIIELCQKVAKEKNYKDAIMTSGKIRALAMACKYDDYWEEKMLLGYYDEICTARATIHNIPKSVNIPPYKQH